jgi:O-antigen/teichoic acid export membrane protein
MTPVQARVPGMPARLETEAVTFSAAAFGIAAVEFVLAQTDKIVLGYYLNPKQVGIYAVAMALVGFVPIALQSVNQIFSPIIAELHATGNLILLQHLYSTLTKWILILTLPLALTMVLFSQQLMGIFGQGFKAGAVVLAIGAVGQFFNCAVGSVGYLLLMSGSQMQLIKIQATNAAFMIALSLLLVPRFGLMGAALAAAITVVTTNVWSLLAVRHRLRLFPYHAGYLKLVAPACLSVGSLLGLAHASTNMHSHWEIAVLALLCAYVSFIGPLLIFGLDAGDREVAKVVWSKIGQNFRRNGVGA